MIRLENLSFHHPGKPLLFENLNLTIPIGIGGILGANGQGKSTLLRLIMGLELPSSGQVLIDGVPVQSLTIKERAMRLSWLSAKTEIYFRFTVRDILEMAQYAHDRTGKECQELLEKVAEETDCIQFLDRLYAELSSGEQQRVDLARVFCQETPIVLLDEPFHHLDIAHRERCVTLLKNRQKDHNLTVLLVSHHIEIVQDLCETVYAIREGGILFSGPVQEGLSKDVIQKTFY